MSFIRTHTYNPATERVVPKSAVVITDWMPGLTHRAALLTLLRENYWTELADQIERETEPPHIPEPGLYGVVKAKYGDTAVRTFVRERDGWSSLTSPGRAGVMCDWDRLIDPVLVRDGIKDES